MRAAVAAGQAPKWRVAEMKLSPIRKRHKQAMRRTAMEQLDGTECHEMTDELKVACDVLRKPSCIKNCVQCAI